MSLLTYKRQETNILFGAIAGDVIGSVFEWHNIKSKKFELLSPKSRFTDDSVMTIATADALLHGRDYATAYQKWGNLYPHAGYGGKFRHWLKEENPQPYNSWGNGAAMRVSPIGWFCKDAESVLQEAKKSASITHNHPEGIKGAQSTALAIFLARNGADKNSIKLEMETRFHYDLSSRTLDDIRPGYSFDVSCQGTLPVALLAFCESTDYEDAIRNAISVGGDSDTIAAITGGIALAFYKTMPQHIVQKVEKRLPDEMKVICREFNSAIIG